MGNPYYVYMIIHEVSEEFRQEAIDALKVFGLERYPQIVADLYHTPNAGGESLYIRPLGSNLGRDDCTRHLRYIRFLADICEKLRVESCCSAQYSITAFDDWKGYQNIASPLESSDEQLKQHRDFFEGVDIADRILRESESGTYKPLFGLSGSEEEKERVAVAVSRILSKNPGLKDF